MGAIFGNLFLGKPLVALILSMLKKYADIGKSGISQYLPGPAWTISDHNRQREGSSVR